MEQQPRDNPMDYIKAANAGTVRKISLPGVFEESDKENSMFYVGEEKPPCSPLSKMPHLKQSEVTSSSEDLPSPRSRTGSTLSTGTEGETDCEGAEYSGRRRSSTLDKTRRASYKESRRSSKSESEADSRNALHKSKSDSVGIIKKGMNKLRSSFRGRRNSTSSNLYLSNIGDTTTESVDDYPRKFVGFFLLIVNFTGDLTGYKKDRHDLKTFFEAQLGYEFREYINCTANELFAAIEKTKVEIQDLASQGMHNIQLIVSVLSHGEVNGIHTCADKTGVIKETDHTGDNFIVTNIDDIISKFKQDEEFSALKGMPKMFFIQACHGEEIVRSAGGSSSNCLKATKSLDGEESCKLAIPVDIDFLVLYAATKYNKSFVPSESGSWLVQTMLQVFRNMSKDTEIEVMLKAVTRAVSEKRGCTYDGDKQELAIQVPFRQSSLSRSCYLQSK